MKRYLSLALVALLAWIQPAVAAAGAVEAAARPAQTLQACPLPEPRAQGIVQAAKTAKCCDGHKGVCGCRAGKLVCCDGTVSADPDCACHGGTDWGLVN